MLFNNIMVEKQVENTYSLEEYDRNRLKYFTKKLDLLPTDFILFVDFTDRLTLGKGEFYTNLVIKKLDNINIDTLSIIGQIKIIYSLRVK